MKEATGELNMTVVTVVAIAALVAIFYAFIWPIIQANMALTSACSSAGQNGYETKLDSGAVINCSEGKCKITEAKGLGVSNMEKVCD